MNFPSLDHYDVSLPRIALASILAGGICAAAFRVVVGYSLGAASIELQLAAATMAAYIVATVPRRALAGAANAQAHEAMVLAAEGMATMMVARSRSGTLMALDSRDEEMKEALTEARRGLLLGGSVEDVARAASARLSSYSAAGAVNSIANLSPDRLVDGGEEASGLDQAAEVLLETRIPIFMALCFFAPLMLLLYSLFGHVSDPVSMAGLVGFEVLILDLAYFLLSGERSV